MIVWETIIAQQGPAVWRTAYRLLSNHSDADECMQDAFVAAVSMSRRMQVNNWEAMLQRLVVSKSMDRLRQRLRERSHRQQGADLEAVKCEGSCPQQSAQNGELEVRFSHALTALPPLQAQAFCLRHLNDMSYEEISQSLAISVRHVGVVLSRAREKLRKLLEDRGADHG